MLILLVSGSACGSSSEPSDTSGPEAVAQRLFEALSEERWSEAASFYDEDALERWRAVHVRRYAEMPSATVEGFHERGSTLTEDEVEEAARYRREFASWGRAFALQRVFAGVSSPDTLRALSSREAAARWLQAREPRYQRDLRLEWGRDGLSEEHREFLEQELASKERRILGEIREEDLAYVLYRVDWVDPWGPPHPDGHPAVLILREGTGSWSVLPRDDDLLIEPGPIMVSVTRRDPAGTIPSGESE